MEQTVGQQLRSAREAQGISIEDAAQLTHMRVRYLQELENDHPEMFVSPVQARGFLRLYADFLNIPYQPLIAAWDLPEEAPEQAEAGEPPTEEEPATKPEKTGLQVKQVGESARDFLSGLGNKIRARMPAPGWLDRIRREKPSADEPGEGQITASEPPAPPQEAEMPPAATEPPQPEDASELFTQIGQMLQERRNVLQLKLIDIERYTSLKRMYLVAMEEGRFDDLPSSVQGRGMLNNYAQFLALDTTSMMDLYARALQARRESMMGGRRRTSEPTFTFRVNLPEPWRRLLNPDLVIGGAFILGLFGFILWGATQIIGAEETPTPEAPSISEMLQVTPSASPTLGLDELAETTPSPEMEAVPGVAAIQGTPTPIATVNAAPLQLYVIANDIAWLRIVVDERTAFDGRVAPDEVLTYSGNTSISLLTGNGAALEVYYNQEYLGKLGDVGEVVNLTFSLDGLRTPTPGPTRTPTPTVMPDGDMDEAAGMEADQAAPG